MQNDGTRKSLITFPGLIEITADASKAKELHKDYPNFVSENSSKYYTADIWDKEPDDECWKERFSLEDNDANCDATAKVDPQAKALFKDGLKGIFCPPDPKKTV